MRAVIQRVERAEVRIDGKSVSTIGPGIFTLLGVFKGDTEANLAKLIQKICALRIFEDSGGKMNLSVADIKGSHLIVSQFTLAGDTTGGRRPSFTQAEAPELARALYERALVMSQDMGVPTRGGVFQADMKVELVNDGPVTFVMEA